MGCNPRVSPERRTHERPRNIQPLDVGLRLAFCALHPRRDGGVLMCTPDRFAELSDAELDSASGGDFFGDALGMLAQRVFMSFMQSSGRDSPFYGGSPSFYGGGDPFYGGG